MPMPIEKATKILNAYKANNYNAAQALRDVGYSNSTSEHMANIPIKSAYRAVAREMLASDNPASTAQLFTRLTDDEIRDAYISIIKQDKDLSTRLKALAPLLKEKGVIFGDDTPTMKPTVNLTMIKNEGNMVKNIEMGGDIGQGDSIVSSMEASPRNDQKDTFTEESNLSEVVSPIETKEEDNIEDSSIGALEEGGESSSVGESETLSDSTKVSPEIEIKSSSGRISGVSMDEAEEILLNING